MTNLHVRNCSIHENADLMVDMHKLRYRVFKERLDWEVAVAGGMEMDRYDSLMPDYLALVDGNTTLLGAVRMLPTTGPNMLADTFPVLLNGAPAPRGDDIWECSRLCVDTERSEELAVGGLRHATHMLIAGIAEWSHARGITKLAAVTDLVVERILVRAGCRVERLAAPKRVGKTMAVACVFEVSARAVAETRAAGALPDRSVFLPAAAAHLNEAPAVRRAG